MIELAFVGALSWLFGSRDASAIAIGAVAADADALEEFLADLGNQCCLADLRRLTDLAGRAGLSCDLQRSVPRPTARRIFVDIRAGRRPLASVAWTLRPRRGTTVVELTVSIAPRAPFARALLSLGGRRWLRRRLRSTLAALAEVAVSAAEEVAVSRCRPLTPAPIATGGA